MEFEHLAIQALAKEVRDEMFGNKAGFDGYSFVGQSAYDTAWVAMVSDSDCEQDRPMFPGCLDWIMENQKEEGYWGDCDAHGMPTIEAITSTLACIVSLKKWNLGTQHVHKGMILVKFIRKHFDLNSVLLHHGETPTATDIDDSVAHIQDIIEKKKKEFLELVFMDNSSNMPRSCRDLHLSCFRFYEMFYSSSNKFESETDLLQDIKRAIYDPLHVESPVVSKKIATTTLCVNTQFRGYGPTKITCQINFRSTWYQNRRWNLGRNSRLQIRKSAEAKFVLMPATKFSFGFV